MSKEQSLKSFLLRGGVGNAVLPRYFDLRRRTEKISVELFIYSGSETKFSAVLPRYFDLRRRTEKISLELFIYSGSETKFSAVLPRYFDLRSRTEKISLELFIYSGSESKFSAFECYNWFTQGINKMGV